MPQEQAEREVGTLAESEVTETLQVASEGKWCDLVRETIPLEDSDVSAIELCGPSRSMSGLQHLRAYHHIVALKLAAGERPTAVSAALGIQLQTITRLSKNLQFQELVETYRGKIVEKAVDHFELMSLCSAEALIAMHERLIGADRDEIPLEALRRVSETFLDRIGHSPVRRSETLSRVSHELSTSTIERIRQLHSEDTAYEAPAIEAAYEEVHQEESESSGAAKCISGAFEPVAKDEANGKEARGADVPAKGIEVPDEGT